MSEEKVELILAREITKLKKRIDELEAENKKFKDTLSFIACRKEKVDNV